MTRRAFTIMLGFANAATARRTVDVYKANRCSNSQFIVVDNHYPFPSAQEMSEFWRAVCQELGGLYLDPGRNLGLHDGLNWGLQAVGATENDVMLGIDPDTRPWTPGFDSALLAALEIPDVGWASLGNLHSEGEMKERGYSHSFENGLRLLTTKAPVVNSVCGFTLDWVLSQGGFSEPSAFYGGLECAMWQKLCKAGKRWVWLEDFREGNWEGEPDLIDPIYRLYKWEHAHKGYPHDFETFVKEQAK